MGICDRLNQKVKELELAEKAASQLSFCSNLLAVAETLSKHRKTIMNSLLGGGFKYFLFSTLFGEDSHFD